MISCAKIGSTYGIENPDFINFRLFTSSNDIFS